MSCHHNLAQKELPVEADISFCNRRDDAIGIYEKVSPMSPKQWLELRTYRSYLPNLYGFLFRFARVSSLSGTMDDYEGTRIQRKCGQ